MNQQKNQNNSENRKISISFWSKKRKRSQRGVRLKKIRKKHKINRSNYPKNGPIISIWK